MRFCCCFLRAWVSLACYLQPNRWTALLLIGGLIPPVWVAGLFIALVNGREASTGSFVAPFVIAAIQILGLWFAWYAYDPRSAGQALAAVEGATAVYQVKKGHHMLGAFTGIGAVSQWRRSTSQPVKHVQSPPALPMHKAAHPAVTPLAQSLKDLAVLHAEGSLSDDEFALAKARLLGPGRPQSASDPGRGDLRPQEGGSQQPRVPLGRSGGYATPPRSS